MKRAIIATVLATSMSATAQVTHISNSEFAESCEGAVKFSKQHAHETDLGTVLDAQWKMMTSEKVGDMEKLVHSMLFLIYQRASYNWEAIMEESTEEQFDNNLFDTCISTLNEWKVVPRQERGSTQMEIESIY